MRFFSNNIIGIIPMVRHGIKKSSDEKAMSRDPLEGICEVLERNEIVLLFPEGTRGEPEEMQEFKSGIAHLAKRMPEVPVYPIFLRGLGKSLPKGDFLLVPFFCDVSIGEPIKWQGDKAEFMERLRSSIEDLGREFDPEEVSELE